MLVRIANPDQTVLQKQSDLGLHCLSRPFSKVLQNAPTEYSAIHSTCIKLPFLSLSLCFVYF